MNRYEITVVNSEDLFYRARVNMNYPPYLMADQLGERYENCTVIIRDLTNGYYMEKDFQK